MSMVTWTKMELTASSEGVLPALKILIEHFLESRL